MNSSRLQSRMMVHQLRLLSPEENFPGLQDCPVAFGWLHQQQFLHLMHRYQTMERFHKQTTHHGYISLSHTELKMQRT